MEMSKRQRIRDADEEHTARSWCQLLLHILHYTKKLM